MTIENLHQRIDKMLVAIESRQQQNYVHSPEWHDIRSKMLVAIQPYQEAGIALKAAITQLESARDVTIHAAHVAIARALHPFIDARIAVAAALIGKSRTSEPNNT